MKAKQRSLLGLVVLVMAVSAGVQAWHAWDQSRIGKAVAQRARPGDIHMLASDTCAICAHARLWFNDNRVAFSECSIEQDASCAAEFRATAAPGTPVLVVRGKPQVGFNPQRLLDALG